MKDEAVGYLVNARLFSSDYSPAKILAEFQRDEGVRFSTQEVCEIILAAEKTWDDYRDDAGVTAPVSHEERREITSMMERAEN